MRTFRTRMLVVAALAVVAVLPGPDAFANRGSTRPVTEKDFSVDRFGADSANVTNKFLPLTPGRQFTLTGSTLAGKHEVIFTVTNVTKWVNGVRALVMWDRDFEDGQLVEEEIAFVAQDKAGNVWYLGEYPEETADDGTISAPATWLAGRQGAIAGVFMRANPKPSTSTYLQGLAPEADFIDRARIARVNQRTCVPTGCYTGVLVVDEWDPSAQPEDGHQFKYHAPGVGVVRIVGKGGTQQENLLLTKDRVLTGKEFDAANARALQLDRRALRLASEVWKGTPPAALR
jgi:hypothetical protein